MPTAEHASTMPMTAEHTSKMPMTAVHYNRHARQYQRSDDVPHVSYGTADLRLSPLPPNSTNKHASSSLVSRAHQVLLRTLVCIAFLTANAAMAVCASLLVLALLSCALLLTPLCCVGVLVLRMIFRLGVLQWLARVDVAFVNIVAPRSDQIQLDASPIDGHVPLHPLLHDDRTPFAIASGLDEMTPASLVTLLYFATLKSVLALLGLFVVGVAIWSPAALLQHVFAPHDSTVWSVVCSALLLALVFAVAVSSLDVVTQLSCASTRLFCCEQVHDESALPITVPIVAPEEPAVAARSKVFVVQMKDLAVLKHASIRPSAVA